jgi:hypothetical protein
MNDFRLETLFDAGCGLLLVFMTLFVFVGLPFGLYQSAVTQQKVINERCGYDYTVRDYFLSGDSIAAICGIEQQQVHLSRQSND